VCLKAGQQQADNNSVPCRSPMTLMLKPITTTANSRDAPHSCSSATKHAYTACTTH
jgi:hypothetical protein